MVVNETLESLRKRVVRARQDELDRLERNKITRELSQLKSPGFRSFKKRVVTTAKAFGRGTAITAEGIQKFAVQRQKVSRLREEGRRKAIPAIKQAVRTKQRAISRFTQPKLKFKKIKKKRRKSSRSSSVNDFGFDTGIGDFGF